MDLDDETRRSLIKDNIRKNLEIAKKVRDAKKNIRRPKRTERPGRFKQELLELVKGKLKLSLQKQSVVRDSCEGPYHEILHVVNLVFDDEIISSVTISS